MDEFITADGDVVRVQRTSSSRILLTHHNGLVRRELILGLGDAGVLATALRTAATARFIPPPFTIVGRTREANQVEDHSVD
jgi:hypothetical protein